MSDIPKSERSESKLEVIHKAYAIRSRITQELLLSFGYSQKKLESHVKKVTAYIRDANEREQKAKVIREMEEDFDLWFIRQEREEVLNHCRGIVQHLIAANTIYPTYTSEFEERRIEMDRAMICCNQLQQELQYLAQRGAIPAPAPRKTVRLRSCAVDKPGTESRAVQSCARERSFHRGQGYAD